MRIIVVIGSQRSGTSVIAAGINSLGVDFGDFLPVPATGDNEKGFFEDIEINFLNVELLNSLGYTWDMPFLPIFDESSSEVFSAFRPAVLDILKRRLEKSASEDKIFGFKDPVLCRLLPLWQTVFQEMNLDVSYVIACRNPMSVAHSFHRRDRFDPIKGYYIWLNSMAAALIYTSGFNRIVVEYDEMMKSPATQLKRIADRLFLNFDLESAECKEYKNGFLTESLRHAKFDIKKLAADKDVPRPVKELYSLLRGLASDDYSEDDARVPTVIKKTASTLEEMRSTLLYMQACEDAVRFLLKKEK